MHKKEEERNKRVKDRAKKLERKKRGIRKKRKIESKWECDSGHAPIGYSLLSL